MRSMRKWKREIGNWLKAKTVPNLHFRISSFEFPISNFSFARRSFLIVVASALTLLIAPVPGFAQGCAMCYTSAAAAKAGAIQALRSGILILLVPPLLMFGAIFVVIYRYRNRFNGADDWSAELDLELRDTLRPVEPDSPEISEFPVAAVSGSGKPDRLSHTGPSAERGFWP